MKYRILSNGDKYIVRYKSWGFWHNFISCPDNLISSTSRNPHEYSSLEKAQLAVKLHVEERIQQIKRDTSFYVVEEIKTLH